MQPFDDDITRPIQITITIDDTPTDRRRTPAQTPSAIKPALECADELLERVPEVGSQLG